MYRQPFYDFDHGMHWCCVCKNYAIKAFTYMHPSGCGQVYVCESCVYNAQKARTEQHIQVMELYFIEGNIIGLRFKSKRSFMKRLYKIIFKE